MRVLRQLALGLAAGTVLVVAVAWMMYGEWDAPAARVHNRSTVELRNIELRGRGFTDRILALASGASVDVTLHPRGESSVDVVFDAGGRTVEAKGDTYIEGFGAYRLQVDIAPDFTVRARYLNAYPAQ